MKRRFEHRHTIIEEIQDKPKRYGCLLIIALISLIGGALKFGAVVLDLAQPYLKLPSASPAPENGSSKPITLADGRLLALVKTESLHRSTHQAIKDVAASEKNGFVAVGWHQADGNKNAAVWWSPNGQQWSRVSDGGQGFEGSGDQYLLAVTSHGDGFVAVGSDKGQAAVYDSPDGRQWFRLRNRDGVFSDGGGQFMSGITSHGGLLVAVGARRNQESGTLMPAAWYRRGSAPWKRATTISPPPSGTGTSEEVQIRDVIATPSRYVAAGSVSFPGDGRERPALWTSETGTRWQSVAGSAEDGLCNDQHCAKEARITDLAANGTQVIAVGYSGPPCNRTASVWKSPDGGMTWARSSDRALSVARADAEMLSVISARNLTIAVGHIQMRTKEASPRREVQSSCGASHVAVWTSRDGRRWNRSPRKGQEPPGTMSAVAADSEGMVVVGSDGTATKGLAWHARN